MATGLSSQGPKSSVRAALERVLRGKTPCSTRVTVRFVKCSTRLSDYGNLVGSYKALLDQLRDCGAIADDGPTTIKEDYEQIPVGKKEVGTWIEINIPD